MTLGESIPNFLDDILWLTDSASVMSCISSDVFYNGNLVWNVSDEVDTISYGVLSLSLSLSLSLLISRDRSEGEAED